MLVDHEENENQLVASVEMEMICVLHLETKESEDLNMINRMYWACDRGVTKKEENFTLCLCHLAHVINHFCHIVSNSLQPV